MLHPKCWQTLHDIPSTFYYKNDARACELRWLQVALLWRWVSGCILLGQLGPFDGSTSFSLHLFLPLVSSCGFTNLANEMKQIELSLVNVQVLFLLILKINFLNILSRPQIIRGPEPILPLANTFILPYILHNRIQNAIVISDAER